MLLSIAADADVRLRSAIHWAVAIALVSSLATTPISAHEGHDHGPPLASLPDTTLPRAAATGDEFEAVAVLKGDALSIYVDRFADNSPVTAAVVSVTIGGSDQSAHVSPNGTYTVAAPMLLQPGRHDVVIAVHDGTSNDLLIATLETPGPTAGAAVQASPASGSLAKFTGSSGVTILKVLGGLAVLVAGLRLIVRRRSSASSNDPGAPADTSVLGLLLACGLLATTGMVDKASAHGDEDHGAVKPAAASAPSLPLVQGDSPRRLPDGTVFVPKPTQRLLDVRTVLAKETPQTPRQSFVGRVIANPNRSGLVQSNSGGRIAAPAAGLPRLGQTVKAGDVLATVTPGSLAIGSANVVQIASDIDQQIALAKTKLERARRLLATNAGTRVQVEETEIQLQGLERRRAEIDTSEVKSETLVAPVDGVISSMRAVPGQVVAPQDVIFEIIDPASLWVEAFVFDATGSQAFREPIASTADGRSMPLAFLGRSRSLRQQSAILQFEIIVHATGLDVGAPVTVHALSGEPVTGVVLPRAAVVRAANGEDIVWRHTEPERFVATPVRVSPFDGANMLVQAGLASGERIVVQGAELINQVR